MNYTEVLLSNLKRYFNVSSIRKLAIKLDYSSAVLLNWSSGRTSPSIDQINEIAYKLGIHINELFIENNEFTPETRTWKQYKKATLINTLRMKRLECAIHESYFNNDFENKHSMSYRAFLRYINGKSKNINLNTLDQLAKIFDTQVCVLLESETKL